MGQGAGQEARLAEAHAAQGFPGPASSVGGGTHLRLDLPQPEDGQRLREAVRNRRSLRLRGDDAADGKTFGPCVGVSRQSLETVLQ